MWGAVKNIERGVNAYIKERKSSPPLSRSALMARINTKVPADFSRSLGLPSTETEDVHDVSKTLQGNGWKLLIVGGAVALACGLDRGVLSKALIFGIARRLGKFGKRL